MRMAITRAIGRAAPLFVACLIGVGCNSAHESRTPPAAGELPGRLTAAKGIRDVGERDKALAQVARDAAETAATEVVDQALGAMHDVSLKDKTAAAVALKLASAGKSEAATATAKKIHDVGLQDKTLAKIAKGETGD